MKDIFNIDNVFKALVIILLATMAFGAKAASVSGNVGLTSDYIFRGQSQTQGDSAISGGFDLDAGKGFYLGAWASEVSYAGSDADLELDSYVGWGTDVNGVSINLSYVDYDYSGDSSLNGSEYQIGLGYEGFSFLHVLGQDGFSDYTEVGYSISNVADVSYGSWDNIGDNWSISRSFDLPMGIEGTIAYVDFAAEDGSGLVDEDSFVFGLSKSF